MSDRMMKWINVDDWLNVKPGTLMRTRATYAPGYMIWPNTGWRSCALWFWEDAAGEK